jgi:hypothetical protein
MYLSVFTRPWPCRTPMLNAILAATLNWPVSWPRCDLDFYIPLLDNWNFTCHLYVFSHSDFVKTYGLKLYLAVCGTPTVVKKT